MSAHTSNTSWRDRSTAVGGGGREQRTSSKRLNSALAGHSANAKGYNLQQLHYAKHPMAHSSYLEPHPDTVESLDRPPFSDIHCGEIFVTANARKWTFVCTYCQKSTRDIGEFICHIRLKHLPDAGDGDIEDDTLQQNETAPPANLSFNSGLEQGESDYLDCGNYLDVNVHTEADELSYQEQERSTLLPTPPPLSSIPPKSSAYERRHAQSLLAETLNSVTPQHSITNGLSAGTRNRRSLADTTSGGELDALKRADGEDYEDSKLLLVPLADPVEDPMDTPSFGSGGGGVVADAELPTSKISKRRQRRGPAHCALCNKTFQYYSLYRNHMIKHSNETPFKCHICHKGFKSKQAIRYHVNTHKRGNKQFKCVLCHAPFATESQHLAHILTHEDSITFPCTVCAKIMHTEKERTQHMAVHSDERPFRCEFCSKLFRLRHHLSNHLKMHRQYKCDYCKEEFASAVFLRKPYACRDCRVSAGGAVTEGADERQPANPLQLFEAVDPPLQPFKCEDLAQMVSDSERGECDDGLDGEDDDETMEDAEVKTKFNVRHQNNNVGGDDGAEQEEDDDDDDDEDDDEDEEDPQPNQLVGEGGVGKDNASRTPVVEQTDSTDSDTKKRYKCKYCPRRYTTTSALNYHMRRIHYQD